MSKGLSLESIKIIRPHSEKDLRLARFLAIVFFPIGVAFLFFGAISISYVGGGSLWLIVPGILLCVGPYIIYRNWNNTWKVFQGSIGTAEAEVIERKRKRIRATAFSTGGGAGELAVVEIGVYLFIRLLEWIGLRDPEYRYIGHTLILGFQATQAGIGKRQMALEVNVSQADYDSIPTGSVIKIRYAMEKPNVALLEKEYETRFGVV
jgi:hypothetical protein